MSEVKRNRPKPSPVAKSEATLAQIKKERRVIRPEVVTGDPDKARRVAEEGFSKTFSRRPHLGLLFADSYNIIASQLAALKKLTLHRSLDDTEVRQFAALSDQLSKLSREERAQEDRAAKHVSELSDQELEDLAKKYLEE